MARGPVPIALSLLDLPGEVELSRIGSLLR